MSNNERPDNPGRPFGLWQLIGIIAVLVIAPMLWHYSPVPLSAMPAIIDEALSEFGLVQAAVCYVVLYTIRPLALFPATILTIASGMVFGWAWGILLTIVGENFSANFAFYLARRIGGGRPGANTIVNRFSHRLREHGVATVVVLRLLYLPFDAVNFGCGLTAMRQRDFALGTFVGILPGIVTFVLVGASVQIGHGTRSWTLVFSAVVFALGLWVARLLRRRESDRHDNEHGLESTP